MCDIAPFQMECINEPYKNKLTICAVSHLYQAFNNLYMQLPIIRDFVKPYNCPHFEEKINISKQIAEGFVKGFQGVNEKSKEFAKSYQQAIKSFEELNRSNNNAE